MHAVVKNLSVTKALEREVPACLAVLPEIGGVPAEFLIARMNGEFAGAAAVLWANWAEPAGFNFAVRVFEAARTRGVGRALVAAAAKLADGETDGLWSSQAIPPASAAARFLESCGFEPRRREHYFRAGVANMLDHIGPLARRYRGHGHIPDDAEVVSLSNAEAQLEEIAWLIAREFNTSPIVNVQTLRRRLGETGDHSLIARLGGEVAGVLLWHIQDGIAVADVRVVSKRWRSGWPNLLLMESGLQLARDLGLQEMKFFCDETLNDTMKLAKRGEGEETDVKVRHYLKFD
jgi:GNAT superfamily N-acetyltransferase